MKIFKSNRIILLTYLILVIVFTIFFVPTYTKTTLITTSSPFSRVTIDGGYRPIWILFEKDTVDKTSIIHEYEIDMRRTVLHLLTISITAGISIKLSEERKVKHTE